jgi:BASS family bile acid:Na+ symporter
MNDHTGGVTTADITMTVIQAGAALSIFAFMFSTGLRTRIADLRYLGTRVGLMLESLLSVDVLVPLIALAVVLLVRPANATAIGLLILAASPAAPMALKKISKAGGVSEYAVSLHIVLALLAILTVPVTLALLSSITGIQLESSPLEVAGQVGLSILLPIVAGMVFGWLFPALAGRIARPLEALSNAILAIVVLIVILSTYHLLLALDIRSYMAIALMIAGALVAGHLMSTGRPEERTTLALESASRNIGLALLIASAYAPLEKALPVLIPYLAASAIIGLIYVRYQKMGQGERSRPEPE